MFFWSESSNLYFETGVLHFPDLQLRGVQLCNGYYGPAFSQPVCATCHAFLYANDLDQEINLQIMSAEEMDPDEDREEEIQWEKFLGY